MEERKQKDIVTNIWNYIITKVQLKQLCMCFIILIQMEKSIIYCSEEIKDSESKC